LRKIVSYFGRTDRLEVFQEEKNEEMEDNEKGHEEKQDEEK
jgi:hypothetical protein